MKRLRWSPQAADDLEAIQNYLAAQQPSLAQPTTLKIYDSIRSLKASSQRGRPGRKQGTRELVLTPLPYLVVYRIKEETIEILHIWHGAQRQT